jgi:outer membrane protein assembly factor BamA
VLAPLVLALALAQQPAAPEVVTEIRVHGNVLTPDAEVRRLTGVDIGTPFTPDTPALVTTRLKATRRFERVEVLKRFASIADPSQIVLVVVVDEGPVRIESLEGGNEPPRVVRRGGFGLMYLPLVDFEDGYGFTYGVQLARPNVAGPHSRLSFPLTWGGDKRAAIQLEKNLDGGVLTRVETGASVSRKTNPFFQQDDDRSQIWLRAERAITPSLRAGATAGWQHVSFLDTSTSDRFTELGADLTFDTRLDPMLARNAVYARASIEHLDFRSSPAANRTEIDGRGYIGLPGQNILVLRALRQHSDAPLPPYLQPLLGGMSNLRGFKAGVAAGDTLVAGSVEVRAPLTSPLSIGKFGVNAFVDVGTSYNNGQRLSDQTLRRGIGGGIWFSVAVLRLNLAVAHGIGADTRVHFGTTLTF